MKQIIYQALTRLWGAGRFTDWDVKTLRYVKSLGCDYIWYTGIPRHATGTEFVKGNPGSPYAIEDWFDTNPYFSGKSGARMTAFESLIRRTHSAGLKVLIDYIPNHVAANYKGEIKHFDYCDYDWTDTLKVDWTKDETVQAMLQVLRFWAAKGVDGFRCDMVELVDASRLSWLINAVKAEFPHLIFVAEVYQKDNYQRYLDAGFDLLYDKSGLYDALVAISAGKASAAAITWNWQSLGANQERMLNFLENHDEKRAEAGNYAALAVSLLFNNATFMLYYGQEVGEDAAESCTGRTSIFEWSKPRMIADLYAYLHEGTALTEQEESRLRRYRELLAYSKLGAFASGRNWDLCYCNTNSQGFNAEKHFAFVRYDDQSMYVVVCNFCSENASIKLRVPEELGLRELNVEVSPYDAIVIKL